MHELEILIAKLDEERKKELIDILKGFFKDKETYGSTRTTIEKNNSIID